MEETTAKRSTRVQAMIDNHLSQYLSADQLAPLTDSELEILDNYFSNYQLRQLKNAGSDILKGLVGRHVKTVEKQRLTNIPEDEVETMLSYYKEVADEVEEVICKECGNLIAIEIKHSEHASDKYFNNPNLHWQGRFVIAVGNKLFGYRRRHDDVMGYRCGARIPNPDYETAVADFTKAMKKWEADVKKAEKKGEATPKMPKMQRMDETIICGNESTMSTAELAAVPDDHLKQSVITQSDILKIKQHINETNYKKPVKKVKSGYELDGKFLLRKVK